MPVLNNFLFSFHVYGSRILFWASQLRMLIWDIDYPKKLDECSPYHPELLIKYREGLQC